MLKKKELLGGILLVMICAGIWAESMSNGIFQYLVGEYQIYTLVESEREGDTSILYHNDDVDFSSFIPETGFKHTANAFLVKAPEMNILIDTGTGSQGVLMEKLATLGIAPTAIHIILLTHLHFDHFGGLASEGKPNFPHAKVYLAEEEYAYFVSGESKNQSAIEILALYGENVITFKAKEFDNNQENFLVHGENLPQITAIANHGHTPGHTIYLIENGSEKILIAGDFLHIAPVQFPHPEISATYDMNPTAAAESRRQVLDYSAKNKIPIGGMHVGFPGIGIVEVEGEGYIYTQPEN